jgi:RNA polymerase sigma factor (sigma-70 family)
LNKIKECPVSISEGACNACLDTEAVLRSNEEKQSQFEAAIMPHLDAAYNLARWLTRHEQNAEDVVQEAFLRAYRYFDRFQGGTGKAWLLRIVRNTCYTWLDRNRPHHAALSIDEGGYEITSDVPNPEAGVLADVNVQIVADSLDCLSPDLREVIVLREIEQLSYKEIAVVTEVPLGTVMSRLARGRQQLQQILVKRMADPPDASAAQPRKTPEAGVVTRGVSPSPGESGSAP